MRRLLLRRSSAGSGPRPTGSWPGNVFGEVPLKVAHRERGAVAREHEQNLIRVARSLGVRARDFVGSSVRLRVLRPHADGIDVRLSECAGRIDAQVDPDLGEIAVLEIAPDLTPGLAFADHGAPGNTPHVRFEIARLLGRETLRSNAPRRDEQVRMPVGAL